MARSRVAKAPSPSPAAASKAYLSACRARAFPKAKRYFAQLERDPAGFAADCFDVGQLVSLSWERPRKK